MKIGITYSSIAASVAILLLAGCQPESKIREYTVPKLAESSHQPSTVAASERRTMLGAIVLAGPDAWFFKATAAPEVVAKHRDAITKFLRGVTFSAAGDAPRWEVPDGWKQAPGDGIRFATIRIESAAPPVEISVTKLPRGDDDAEAILQNVNRWRGQMQLPETTAEDLAKEAEQFKIGEFPCTLVVLAGSGSGSMGGPFSGGPLASGLPKDHPSISQPGGAAPSSDGGMGKLTFAVPAGWKELPAGGFRQASFEVADGEQKADVSVTVLSLQGGDVVANVNRWREQVGLSPQSEENVFKNLREVKGQGLSWQVAELVGKAPSGEPQAILGAIGKTADAAWFVKFSSPPPLAERERQHFDEFVSSLKVN